MKDLYSLKGLVWRRLGKGNYTAKSILGEYRITDLRDTGLGWKVQRLFENSIQFVCYRMFLLREAKAAAQAHYKERLMPALKKEGER